MKIRRGKTKNILESSIDSVLLAVEIFNKPRASFRKEVYIALMINAWTKLFHAFFNSKIGDHYFYKKNEKYVRVDGNERKAWDLDTCIDKFIESEKGMLSESVISNLKFLIGLRNKIEHRYVTKAEIEKLVFGECQSCLYNFERLIINLFGEEYALNENLAFSLQFSSIRTLEQNKANRKILSKDMVSIRKYIEDFRSALSKDVFDSQEYSVKLIKIPKISNTKRNDVAIEFVKWNELSSEDKKKYVQLTALIKDKIITREAVNVGKLRPKDVVYEVRKKHKNFDMYEQITLAKLFGIKPVGKEVRDKFDTNSKFCQYDEAHNDYLYTQDWVNLINKIYDEKKIGKQDILKLNRANSRLRISDFT